jgi:hypothetical protein
MANSTRFVIKFDPAYALLSTALLIFPSDAYVDVAEGRVSVRMGWAFRATFDVASITGIGAFGKRIWLTRGVHGWGGRWLVNGAGEGILAIDLGPSQRAHVAGFPVRLRQVLVSVEDPDGLATALARQN